MSIHRLKGLIGESQEIRKGNLSGKKKKMAKKMNNPFLDMKKISSSIPEDKRMKEYEKFHRSNYPK